MRRLIAGGLLVATALAGCGLPGTSGGGGGRTGSDPTSASPTPDPDTPSSWGPTLGEIDRARELVAEMTPEQLAGQVIVGRFYGTDPAEPAALVRDLNLAGIQITSTSIVDRDQVLALTSAVSDASAGLGRDYPAIIGVDQEGGYVSHLDGIATEFPAFEAAGATIQAKPERGPAIVQEAARTTALELRQLGFTWVFAPVADVTVGDADPTIGSRSPSDDAEVAATAVEAAVQGYDDAGIVSTTKHFPGHGSAPADSHDQLPVVSRSLEELAETDLVPFRAAVDVSAPSVMMAHLNIPALAPGVPSSLAPETYDLLRDDLGFEGVAVTDSLGMGAVVATEKPAVTALKAGADLLLMPADTRGTHRTVTAAISSGELSRERVEEAAARVVALQLWQQRVAGETPVPADIAEQAAAASAALSASY